MAHALDTRDNGATSFVSLRKPAWHRLGTIAQDELSYEEALTLGGLDYRMTMRPVTTTMPIFDADGEEVDNYEIPTQARAIVRLDTKTVFGVVGDQYELVTNRQATQVVDALVGEGLARIETAGALNGGRDAFMMLRFVGADFQNVENYETDPVNFYGMVRANHSGKTSVQLATTPIRVVCANTLAACLSNGKTAVRAIRHTKSAHTRLVEEAQALWGGVLADAVDMSKAFARFRQRELTPAQFNAVLELVAPMPSPLPLGATQRSKSLMESAVVRAEQARLIVRQMLVTGTGVDGSLSAWNVFNAVTEAIDHHGVLAGQRGQSRAEPLTAHLIGGSIATAKAAVWNQLLAVTA